MTTRFLPAFLLMVSTTACVSSSPDETTRDGVAALDVIPDDDPGGGGGGEQGPATQVSISGRPASETQVALAWVANGTVASYSVTQTLTGAGAPFVPTYTTTYAGTANGATITLDPTLVSLLALFGGQNPVFQYSITALGTSNQTLATSSVLVSLVPEAPTHLVAASANGTTLTWTDASLAETSFDIERAGSVATSVAQNVTTHDFANDVYGIAYRVRSSNRWGQSAWSNAAELVPSANAQSVSLAVVPTGQTEFSLSWSDDGAAASFVVEEELFAPGIPSSFTPPTTVATDVGSIAASSGAYTYSNATLGLGAAFSLFLPNLSSASIGFRVTALDPQGATLASSGWVTTSLVPAAPSNLTATLSGTDALLQWVDNSGNETSFDIDRTGESMVSVTANTTSYTDVETSVIPYRVRATNEFGSSAWSNYALP